jgi:uncharacterized spore protein YtfJ
VDVENLLAKVADNLSVRRAFGSAYEKDGTLIIPVAIVAGGGGGGTGHNRHGPPAAGPDSPPEAAATPRDGTAQDGTAQDGTARDGTARDGTARDGTAQDSGRTEAGGGFGGLVLPSGAYVVQDGQVRWVPAVDVTLAVLASLSLVRLLVRTWTRHRSHRRRR